MMAIDDIRLLWNPSKKTRACTMAHERHIAERTRRR
jgi:hypothetical protein